MISRNLTICSDDHAEIVYAIGALFTALNLAIRLALFFHPLADWVAIAQRQPRLAALVRLLDALGISPVSVLQAFVDLVRGEASKGTLASARAMARKVFPVPAGPMPNVTSWPRMASTYFFWPRVLGMTGGLRADVTIRSE